MIKRAAYPRSRAASSGASWISDCETSSQSVSRRTVALANAPILIIVGHLGDLPEAKVVICLEAEFAPSLFLAEPPVRSLPDLVSLRVELCCAWSQQRLGQFFCKIGGG